MEVKRRLAAIMAADVVGYSRLVGQDEEGTLRRVRALLSEVVRPLVADHRGRVVKTMGDGFLGEFTSVVQAFHCAVKLQLAAAERNVNLVEEARIVLRIGINIGDIIFERGDVFGDGVIIASRLEGMAQPGGICVSERAHEDLRKLDLPFEDLGEVTLKNIARPVRAYAIQPPGKGAGRTVPPGRAAAEAPATPGPPTSTTPGRRPAWLVPAAGIGLLAAAVGGVAMLDWAPASRRDPVAIELERIPCSWLRIAEQSDIDGGSVVRLSGAALFPPDVLARTLVDGVVARGGAMDRVVASDVAPLSQSQCAWVDKLRAHRYRGVPRYALDVKPRGNGLSQVKLTLDPRELGVAGAVYGVDPGGRMERIVEAPRMASAPGATRNPDGSITLSLMVDHVGWNGFILMESAEPAAEALVTAPAADDVARQAFEAAAKAGGWRFELAWFKVGS